MLTLETPHQRWLKNKEEDNNNNNNNNNKDLEEEDEEEYKAALGTCPPVPELKKNYGPIIELIACCCNENWRKRPRARRIVKVITELMDKDE